MASACALVVAVIGCDGLGRSEYGDSTKGQAMLDRVTLTADFRMSPARIAVPFAITNDRDTEIYVVDRAFQVVPSGATLRKDHLVVTFGAARTAVLSSTLVLPNPKVAFATPPVFYATRVAPGARYVNEVGAPLPLRPEGWKTPRTPEGAVLSEAVVEGQCTQVRFELGVIPGLPGSTAQPLEIGGVEVVQVDVLSARRQVVLAVERSDIRIPCLSLAR